MQLAMEVLLRLSDGEQLRSISANLVSGTDAWLGFAVLNAEVFICDSFCRSQDMSENVAWDCQASRRVGNQPGL